MNRIGFDTETTGVDVKTARILTASIVEIISDNKVNVEEYIINPGVDIPEDSIKIHGMTNEWIENNGASPKSTLNKIARSLEKCEQLVIYNSTYDYNLLNNELKRYGLKTLDPSLKKRIIDPLIIDRHFNKLVNNSRDRTLESVCEVYGVKIDGDLHNATTDTKMSLKLYEAMEVEHPVLAKLSKESVYDLQYKAYNEWATGFNKWLLKKGKPDTVPLNWLS